VRSTSPGCRAPGRGWLMSLPTHQERILGRTADSLHASVPHLASMFAIFTRLARDEDMPPAGSARCVVVAILGLAPAADPTTAEQTVGPWRRGGMRVGRQAARDPAGPDHAGGAGACHLPRPRRAQRERLRTGGPAAVHRTCAESAQGLPVGAATSGLPATAKWMTPAPAGRSARRGAVASTPHGDPACDGKTGARRDANDVREVR
jgi:hypothetical protein